jgi:hypothetical protein
MRERANGGVSPMFRVTKWPLGGDAALSASVRVVVTSDLVLPLRRER